MPRAGLEEDDAHRVDVGPAVDVDAPLALLGRHVLGGPHAGALDGGVARAAGHLQGRDQPEVHQGDALVGLVDEDVLGLEVAVDVARVVDGLERVERLHHQGTRGGERHRLGAPQQQLRQGPRGEILHHQVGSPVAQLAAAQQRGHVRSADRRQHLHLVREAEASVRPIRSGELDRHPGAAPFGLGLEDRSEPAHRDQPEDAVPREGGAGGAGDLRRIGVRELDPAVNRTHPDHAAPAGGAPRHGNLSPGEQLVVTG